MQEFKMAALMLATLTVAGLAQNQPAWTERSAKDVERILNDSPWGQTQVETDISEMTYSPTNGSSGKTSLGNSATMRAEQAQRNNNRAQEGAYNKAVGINYRIRLLSAKPIREAIAQDILLHQAKLGDDKKALELRKEMQSFIDRDFVGYIAVAVTYDADDGRLAGKAFQDFNSAIFSTLKNNTYLELDDGQRVFLIDYRGPIEDGIGARFVFPRMADGRPFVTKDTAQIRFYSEVGPKVTLNRRFKVSDMFYQGKLEY